MKQLGQRTPAKNTGDARVDRTFPDVRPPLADGWRYGTCYGMSGCGWAQHGDDNATWKHFESEDEARGYATLQAKPTVERALWRLLIWLAPSRRAA